MMRLLLLGVLVATTSSQTTRTTIDPNVWTEIFGPPPLSTPAAIPSSTQLANKNGGTSKGQACECIPHYQCIEKPQNTIADDVIDIRFAPGDLKIRAGEWDTQSINKSLDFQERIVNDIHIHPDFTRKKLKNDIAVLRLEKPVDLADHIDIICMPEPDEVFDNYKGCIANGWGKNSFGKSGIYSEILKKVEVDMVPHTRCEILLKRTRLGSRFKLHESFICAGGEEGKDTCQGDGGAPLVCPMGDNRYKLTGLVSWGIGCGQQDIPAVYTDVAKFRVWVQQKMKVWGLRITTYRPDV